jgi:hypothetical protein
MTLAELTAIVAGLSVLVQQLAEANQSHLTDEQRHEYLNMISADADVRNDALDRMKRAQQG